MRWRNKWKSQQSSAFSGRGRLKKEMDCNVEGKKKDVAVMSSLFANIVLPVCHCILNNLADKVADN